MYFTASGGTGAYHFELSSNQSGGDIVGLTGAYDSGPAVGAVDTITLTDLGCDGQLSTTVQVVSHLQVSPLSVHITPSDGFSFDISGGSGRYTCTLRENLSNADVTSDCTYTAGALEGRDRVRVQDVGTGETVDALITVDPNATLRVVGGGHLFIPKGSRLVPTTIGGSGFVDIHIDNGPLSYDGQAFLGDATGVSQVRFVDRYTSMERDTTVTVVAPHTPTVPRDGERSGDGVVHTVDDIDGDGYADGVFGFTELSVDAHFGGAVMIYAGAAIGLQTEPVQTFTGTTIQQSFGRDVEIADLDRDGHLDLIIGSDKTDHEFTNVGAVYIHRGIPNGFFEDEPTRTLYGTGSGDRFGASVVACDFDGDGYLDLAVGAIDDEDLDVSSPAREQGAVHVFHGSAAGLSDGDGFGDAASFIIYGTLPDEDGQYRPRPKLRLGETIRAGDLDGDGYCDLAVATSTGAASGSLEDGAVVIYRGTADKNTILTRSPVRWYADTVGTDSNFGSAVEIADIDNDGADDLAIAQYRSDINGTRGGAVFVHLGDSLIDRDPGDRVRPSEADWVFTGAGNYDYAGQGLSFSDLDGDDHPDLLIGVSRAEDVFPFDAGHIYAFAGATIMSDIQSDPGHDATEDSPAYRFVGGLGEGRLGQAVGGAGRGGVLTLAGHDSTYGIESGALYYMSTGNPSPRLLDTPGQPAGHEFGRALALYDVDGDGTREFLLGGPNAAQGDLQANAGMVFAYDWAGGVLASFPTSVPSGYREHDGTDRFGYALSTAGDFNGDGFEDLAVVARGDEHPGIFDAEDYTNPTECPGPVSLTGSVLVYLGQPSGLTGRPAFIGYGYGRAEYMRLVRGGFDIDNDGYDDLLLASYGWDDNAGGFSIVRGRGSEPSGITVMCAQERYLGVHDSGYLGTAAAPLGDIDGDGCDDLAIGAPREDAGMFEQGVVRVLWGYGGAGCPVEPAVTTLVYARAQTRLGAALAGGGDFDGDGILDLAVGGSEYRVDGDPIGAAWIVLGSYLLTLPRQSFAPGALPAIDMTSVSTLLPRPVDQERYGLIGTTVGGLFGDALALIPDPLTPGRHALAIGIPQGDVGGEPQGGGVVIHRYIDDAFNGLPGLDPIPHALLAGEPAYADGALGQVLDAHDVDGVSTLLVGAPTSSQNGLDVGAGYVLRLTP